MKQLNKKEIKKTFKEYKRQNEIYVILENIQYARNVASAFRTADAAGVSKIILTGISKVPPFGKELSQVSRSKEKSVTWEYFEDTSKAISNLKRQGFKIVAIELTDDAQDIQNLPQIIRGQRKVCLLVGSEVFGVKNATLANCDAAVFIPMYGRGASLNVSASLAIGLYSF